MAQPAFRIETKPTFRDLQGRFVAANEELLRARRDELRQEGGYLEDEFIRKLRAKIGQPSKIEKGVRFNTRQTGNSVKLNLTAPGKAAPHPIRPKNAGALAFFWPKVGLQVFVPRQGGFKTHVSKGNLFVGKGQVDHPGGTLVPLLQPIMQDLADEWTRGRGSVVLNRIATRYVTAVTK